MLVGKCLPADLPALEASIRTRYFALTQKPLIACLKDAANRYRAALDGESMRSEPERCGGVHTPAGCRV